MWRFPSLLKKPSTQQTPSKKLSTSTKSPPIIRIDNGTFYRKHPSATDQDAASNHPMFPGLKWSLPSDDAGKAKQQHWAVVGPSNAVKTTFFDIIRGQHLCIPPAARSFPYLSTKEVGEKDPRYRNVSRAIQYVGFDGERVGVGNSTTRGAYLSARYESRREATDFSVMDFLRGTTHLNPSEEQAGKDVKDQSLDGVISDLKLEPLVNMPMGNLSNGQTRRARIAKALLGKPMVLILDEPFMGLDPPTITTLSPLLHSLAQARSPRLILSLRPQDPLPDWITHLIRLGNNFRIIYQGSRELVSPGAVQDTVNKRHSVGVEPLGRFDIGNHVIPQRGLAKSYQMERVRFLPGLDFPSFKTSFKSEVTNSRGGIPLIDTDVPGLTSEILVEMQGVRVKYGDKEVLGSWEQEVKGQRTRGLSWTVRRGERWGVFGPNGSGKTTLVSLICSDHPQAYSLPIKVFGRGRLPQQGSPGISIFDIQSRIGQTSPEIHAFFPRNLSLRQTIENAWADTFLATPRLTYENDVDVDTCLRWFESDLNPAFTLLNTSFQTKTWKLHKGYPNSVDWADKIRFGDAPFSAQRLALFLRAIIKKPDLVVLDEAFSSMDDRMRDKCMLFLTWGETKSFGIAASREQDVRDRFVYNTPPELLSEKLFEGLSKDQALICVSHIKEEVPGVVRQWMSLPEAGTGNSVRFGRFPGPLEGSKRGWDEVWGV